MDSLLVISTSASGKPIFGPSKLDIGASLVAQLVKNLPAMQETPVQSLDWEDPLEKEMATHFSTAAAAAA